MNRFRAADSPRRPAHALRTAFIPAALLGIVLAATGCGTFLAQINYFTDGDFDTSAEVPIYSGAFLAFNHFVYSLFSPPVGLALSPVFLADIPVSLAADTVLLPVTVAETFYTQSRAPEKSRDGSGQRTILRESDRRAFHAVLSEMDRVMERGRSTGSRVVKDQVPSDPPQRSLDRLLRDIDKSLERHSSAGGDRQRPPSGSSTNSSAAGPRR